MNILIITHGFISSLGGGALVIYNYAKQLSKLGNKVTLLSRKYDKKVLDNDFEHIMLPGKYNNIFYIREFKEYFKTFDLSVYDKIILNEYPSSVVAGRFFSPEQLSKCISIIQGFEVEGVYKNKNLRGYLFNHLLLKTHENHKRCMQLCNKVVSVSEFHKNKVIKAASLENYRDKFKVVYTGINRDDFYKVNSSVRDKYKLHDKQILLSASRVEPMKGYNEMLSIFEKLHKKDSSFVWLITGDGIYLDRFKQKVNSLGLSDVVIFIGRLPNDKLKEFYSAADCFWLLSNYEETFGLVYLEAASCELPSIGKNRGGVTEAIIDGKTGYVVDSEQECYEILLNKKYKNLKKSDMLDFAKSFDCEQSTKELIK